MDYGLQLFSVRDFTADDLEGTLAKVAEMGYKTVEFAGYFGHSGADIKRMLDENGLKAIGTHSGADGLRPEYIQESIAFHREIGCENYVIPGHDLSTAAKIDEFIEIVNRAQPILEAAGMKLHYHNHSHEFFPNADGQIIHEELEKRTDMMFEIDTYWAFNAGRDPVEMLERLKKRISLIHLKDGFKGGIGKSLGQGEAPVKAVLQKAVELGLGIIVESEGLDPDGISESRRCIEFLKEQNY
ncbi:MAG: sugar phosphate isomerase/epimerase [Clostridia bacterium]|jgi:sugar phosphate isomerase/epimerase|nr:sugar phosphate isomerase/epimerase [Clostridia bacterium]MBO7503400.1 sugar phosphate isomerase/epimerase [Clostridia bacterium]